MKMTRSHQRSSTAGSFTLCSNRWLFSGFMITLVSLLMLAGCSSSVDEPPVSDSEIPIQGVTPLPLLSGETRAKGAINKMDMNTIRMLLEREQRRTGYKLLAIQGTRFEDGSVYKYQVYPLEFSPQAMKEAGGATQPFRYQATDSTGIVMLVIAALIPKSDRALAEMTRWVLPDGTGKGQDSRPAGRTHRYECQWVELPAWEICMEGDCWGGPAEWVLECEEGNYGPHNPVDHDEGGSGGGGTCAPPQNCNGPGDDGMDTYDCDLPWNVPGDIPCEEESIENPCQQMVRQERDRVHRDKLEQLKHDAHHKNYETAYVWHQGAMNTNIYNYQQGQPGEHQMVITISGLGADGMMHSHFGENSFGTFSGEDLRFLYRINRSGHMRDHTTFTSTVVTAHGTSYSLKITDLSAFISFANTHFSSDAAFSNFEDNYELTRKAWVEPFGEAVGAEMALLNMIRGSGLMLFRGNANFTSWQAIEKPDPTTSTIVNADCSS